MREAQVRACRRDVRADLHGGGGHGLTVEVVADQREHVLGKRTFHVPGLAQLARGAAAERDVLGDRLGDPGGATGWASNHDGEVLPDDHPNVGHQRRGRSRRGATAAVHVAATVGTGEVRRGELEAAGDVNATTSVLGRGHGVEVASLDGRLGRGVEWRDLSSLSWTKPRRTVTTPRMDE
jgi:hypothetical protein